MSIRHLTVEEIVHALLEGELLVSDDDSVARLENEELVVSGNDLGTPYTCNYTAVDLLKWLADVSDGALDVVPFSD